MEALFLLPRLTFLALLHPASGAFLSLAQFWHTWERLCMNQVTSLLSVCCMMLGYSFELRQNSLAVGTVSSVMTIGSSINGWSLQCCSCKCQFCVDKYQLACNIAASHHTLLLVKCFQQHAGSEKRWLYHSPNITMEITTRGDCRIPGPLMSYLKNCSCSHVLLCRILQSKWVKWVLLLQSRGPAVNGK